MCHDDKDSSFWSSMMKQKLLGQLFALAKQKRDEAFNSKEPCFKYGSGNIMLLGYLSTIGLNSLIKMGWDHEKSIFKC